MFKTSVKSKDNSGALAKLMKDLSEKQVYVGIPEEKAPRKKGEISNAQLMFIHTNGSPLRNIPARPVIESAIEATGNKEPIVNELAQAAQAALDLKPGEANQHLKLAGMLGQNAARAWFTDPRNGWPPDAPETVKRKGSERPLIDTGQMRKAIIYVIKDEK